MNRKVFSQEYFSEAKNNNAIEKVFSDTFSFIRKYFYGNNDKICFKKSYFINDNKFLVNEFVD